jgi:polar amino acid transport system substrate-binding protein
MKSLSHYPRRLAGAVLAAGLLWLGVSQARADDLATIKQRGTLIVGVKADYPPFGFRAPSGQIEGIEPALAADVAKSLGVKLDLVPVVAANRMQFLEQGKIDLMLATLTVTPEREKILDIVKPYYYAAGYNVMLPKSMNAKAWTELKDKPVCGIQGAYYNKAAAEKFGIQVIAFTGTAEALTAMKQGRCVGLLYDDTSIEGDLLQPEWSSYDMPLESQDSQPWGAAVRLGQPEWSAYMKKMLVEWAKDGTIQKLETKYHIKPSTFAAGMHEKYSDK